MRKSLYLKLTLAFMLVAFFTASLVAVFIRVTSADRLTRLLIDQQRGGLAQALADYYIENGSWRAIAADWRDIQEQIGPQYQAPVPVEGLPPDDRRIQKGDEFDPDRRSLFGLAAADGQVLIAADRDYPPGSQLPTYILNRGTPIEVDGRTVGILLTNTRPTNFNPAEAMFLQRMNQGLLLAMVGALLFSLAAGILLARTLTRPLLALTDAAQNIARGKLEQQVKITSNDEIGQLAGAFNQMSQEVARANQLRQQMTADIAHDLRTPLTVIGGYIESMRDGVLQPTPQRLSIIYEEIERLQSMVNDLRMLSQVDAGELSLNPQKLNPHQILEHAAELFQHHAHQQNITLSIKEGEPVPAIFVDEARMMQVMDNVISNALRYTPAGGKITLSAQSSPGGVELLIQDNGSGIPTEELPLVFNRFHRADKSRHSESGESGLGLAIVKALVEAQKGRVWAESTMGQGTTIHLEFPQSI